MRIQEKKSIRRMTFFMTFFVLVFTLVAPGEEGKWDEQEPLLVYLIDSGEITLEMAELLHINCRLELLNAEKTLLDLELQSMEERSSDKGLLNARLSGTKVHETVNILRSQVKQMLLNCVRRNNFMLPNSGEQKASEIWYTRYLGILFTRHYSSRQRELAQTFGEAPAPSPTVSSPSPAPSFPIAPNPQLPSTPPFFPPDLNDANLQPIPGEHSFASASDLQSSKQKTNERTVIIAVVITAGVTFVVAALLFFCWHGCCGTGFGWGRNDERPLLSLSLSDYSIGTRTSKEKFGNQSFNSKLNQNKINGKFYVASHSLRDSKVEIPVETIAVSTVNSAEDSVELQPGILGTPRLSPLKPPPGRIDPLKPPSDKAAPPLHLPLPLPPPPIPAPPPIKPSSGGPCPSLPPGPPPPPPIPCGVKTGPCPPPPPPIPSGVKTGAHPPPPHPGTGVPPPRPPPVGLKPPRPVPSHPSTSDSIEEEEVGAPKAKLKPFFWDKVLANPDPSMVWHQVKSGSFQLNEEMIEMLFGYAPADKIQNDLNKKYSSQDLSLQYIQIIDPKKSQNLSILLKVLNLTTEEVCDALEEGNELPSELIQTLLKMAPRAEEELKLRLYTGKISQLGPAERFLKVLVDIPFAFRRLESLLFICTLREESSMLKESFSILEAACTELKKSRLFLKLLEAVLKTGNRMNDGTFRGGAQAFKLDTLLKLLDVKGTDGKTTLLHFVVHEIIRSEGARTAKESQSTSIIRSDGVLDDSTQDSDEHFRTIGLHIVSCLGNELENVKKAAVLDDYSLRGTVAKLDHALLKTRDFLYSDMKNVAEENGYHQTLKSFVQNAEVDVMWLVEEEKRITALVKSTSDYFHGNAGKDEGLRLFVIVRDFVIILDKVCKEVENVPRKSSGQPTTSRQAISSC